MLRRAAQPCQYQLTVWEFRVELPQLVEVGVDMQRELGGPIEYGHEFAPAHVHIIPL